MSTGSDMIQTKKLGTPTNRNTPCLLVVLTNHNCLLLVELASKFSVS